jgi:mannose/fructose/sorbose-specific phosphotransferase system IIA component
MEIRGLGIINIKDLFGVAAIRETKKIELVINMEEFDEKKIYDRLGLITLTHDILGVSIPKIDIPVRPGRTLTSIIEVAARNQILKVMGHHSAMEFQNKIDATLHSETETGDTSNRVEHSLFANIIDTDSDYKKEKQMFVIILCCHGVMARGVKDGAELIVGPQQKFEALGIHQGEGIEILKNSFQKAIDKMEKNEGIIILTDIPGGTPFQVSAMIVDNLVRMITGFNMPLLLKLLMDRQSNTNIQQIIESLPEYGREHIIDASFLMRNDA